MLLFPRLLEECLRYAGGRKAMLARAIGVSPFALSRLLSGKQPATVEQCLRLARFAHLNASDVLRAAGRPAIAELIESLYGSARHLAALPDETSILEAIKALGPQHRKVLEQLLRSLDK